MKKKMINTVIPLLLIIFLLCTHVSYASVSYSTTNEADLEMIHNWDLHESVITDYFSAINEKNIESLIELSANSMRHLLANIYTNSTNISNNVGIYNINSILIDKIAFPTPSLLSPYYDEKVLSQYDSFVIGLVCATVDVVFEDESIMDGSAYYCVQLVEDAGDLYVYDAVLVDQTYASQIISGASTHTVSTPIGSNILYYPSSIKVYRAHSYAGESPSIIGTIQEVSFSNYCNICLQGEGGAFTNAEALRAIALAIQCFGFHQYLYRNSISLGFHVLDSGSDDGGTNYFLSQYYNPQLTPTTAVRNAVYYVSKYFVLDAKKRLIPTYHYDGTNNADGKHSGRLRQRGANYLATNTKYLYSFSNIIHYFYDKPLTAVDYYNNDVATGNVLVHQHSNSCTSMTAKTHNLYCASCGNTHTAIHVFVPDPVDGNMVCAYCGFKAPLP